MDMGCVRGGVLCFVFCGVCDVVLFLGGMGGFEMVWILSR